MATAAQKTSQEVAQQLLNEAATRGERAVSYARIVFCLANYARFIALGGLFKDGQISVEALLETPAVAIAVLFSLYVLRKTKSQNLAEPVLIASVVLDAMVCFVLLLPNVLWPWPAYTGIVRTPDVTAILVATFAAGLRLSPRVAVLAAICNLAQLGALVSLDIHRSQPDSITKDIVLSTIIFLATALLSVVVAARTRRLVLASAKTMTRAERAKRSLGAVLEDQHDLRTLLASASLNADRVLEFVNTQPKPPAAAERLHQDLTAIQEFLAVSKERAHGHVASLQSPTPVDLLQTIQAAIAIIQVRFPSVRFTTAVSGTPHVLVAGGITSLQRICLNILGNACEGDGTTSARQVDVRAAPIAENQLLFEVQDDGPGFSDALLARPTSDCMTSKSKGSGLGLFLVESLLAASGGQLARLNRSGGGARLRLYLRTGQAQSS